MSDYIDVPAYLQVEPIWAWGVSDKPSDVHGGKVVTVTQKPPRARSGVVVTKVTLRIAKSAFVPLRPEAVVVIPEELTQPHPIEVVADDPNEIEE